MYRGVAGGALPEDFWTANDDGVMGGVDMAFMSTSTDRDVALDYMKMQDKKFNRILFEVRRTQTNTVSCRSGRTARGPVTEAALLSRLWSAGWRRVVWQIRIWAWSTVERT